MMKIKVSQHNVIISATIMHLISSVCDTADIEFWRMPSRRFYVAKASDFEELQKTDKRKKLSLKRKSTAGSHIDLTNEPDDFNDSRQFKKIEDTIKKVCNE